MIFTLGGWTTEELTTSFRRLFGGTANRPQYLRKIAPDRPQTKHKRKNPENSQFEADFRVELLKRLVGGRFVAGLWLSLRRVCAWFAPSFGLLRMA